MKDLDCANCAAKMEAAINQIDGITKATVSFMTQRLTIECDVDQMDEMIQKAQRAISKIEPDCRIIL